jgi:hypothetical protein
MFRKPLGRYVQFMYVKIYQFANMVLRVESTVPLKDSVPLMPFLADASRWDYRILVTRGAADAFACNGFGTCRRDNDTYHVLLNEKCYQEVTVLQVLSFLPMLQMLLEKDMFVLHASFVKYQGDAVLFSGRSGVGKSTQAALWQQCFGAETINGDRTLLYQKNGQLWASGWFQSGTSGINHNDTCPVKAIVFLEHGKDNVIHALSGLSAFKQLLCQSAYQTEEQEQVCAITSLVAALVNQVPVYHYQCGKDAQAADLLKKILYG